MGMREIIRAALFTPIKNGWGLPLAFEAGPGTSKSDVIEAICREVNLYCEVLAPGERGEGQFGVVPMPKTLDKAHPLLGNVVLDYPAPGWAIPFADAGRGVLFCDELTTSPPAIQPSLLGLFLRKMLGAHHLGGGVRCIAAYNAPKDAAAGYELSKPAANRMGHILFDAGDGEQWTDWLLADDAFSEQVESTFDPVAEEARVLAAWPEAYATAKGIYASFIRKRPELLHKEPAAGSPEASRAWPSRRTHAYACRALATTFVHDLDEEDRDTLISAFIGSAAAGEFITFLNTEDLPDPAAILDGREDFKHDPRRLDRTYAVLNSCTALVSSPKCENQKARVEKMWDMLLHVVDKGGKDIAFGSCKRLSTARLLGAKNTRPVLKKINAVLEAADIRGT